MFYYLSSTHLPQYSYSNPHHHQKSPPSTITHRHRRPIPHLNHLHHRRPLPVFLTVSLSLTVDISLSPTTSPSPAKELQPEMVHLTMLPHRPLPPSRAPPPSPYLVELPEFHHQPIFRQTVPSLHRKFYTSALHLFHFSF
ncbi:hypothetical protein RND81_04G182000 [Saponaria officinalis]|uniref:Uncharacterized protein n=1 Tax=Saponaria officinalis TaxID=3572 RepID=A0AAW1LNE7_SAPOF